MSTYVMGDIHGHYDTFMKMIERIGLKDDDRLYILGDVIDRGPDGIKLVKEIMKMENVQMLLGNHELLMMDAIRNAEECEKEGRLDTDDLDVWLDECNGGRQTYEDFKKCSAKKKAEILIFFDNLPVAMKIKVGKKTYYLSHAYVVNKKFDHVVKFNELIPKDVFQAVWQNIYDTGFTAQLKDKIFPNKRFIYVSGHVFTQRLGCVDAEGRGLVYDDKEFLGEYHVINLDCGMALCNKSSRLACIRLDDGEIMYESLEE